MLRLDIDAWSADQLAEQQAKDPELPTIYDWKLAALETGSDEAPRDLSSRPVMLPPRITGPAGLC